MRNNYLNCSTSAEKTDIRRSSLTNTAIAHRVRKRILPNHTFEPGKKKFLYQHIYILNLAELKITEDI